MRHILIAFILWRVIDGTTAVSCDHWKREWCGYDFWGCANKLEYRCVQNVEILEQEDIKPVNIRARDFGGPGWRK